MKAVCPCCAASASIEAFLNDAEARHAVSTAAALPAELGPLVLRYIALFRPAKRQLQWPRVRKLVDEVAAMIEAGEVEYFGRRYPVGPRLWAQAMTQMLNTASLQLPLTSHGYLIKILAGESPRAASAAEAASEELRRIASQQRAGSRSQAIAELSAEIGYRKRQGLPALTEAEQQAFLAQKGGEL